MSKSTVFIAAIATLFAVPAAHAAPVHAGPFETCMQAALAKHPGQVLTVEAEIADNRAHYEFDILASDGREWEVECDAKRGKVIEIEQEVSSPDHHAFHAQARVSVEQARKTALAKFPGEVLDTEYAIEASGSASYEFDIKTRDGREMEVEVDASSGKIIETEQEVWQIGLE